MPSLRQYGTSLVALLALIGTSACGPYEEEPETPYGYVVRAAPAEPPTSAELAANPPPRVSASEEYAIGESSDAASAAVDTDPSALTEFHDTLAPHGQWVDDATYGTIWQPSAAEVGDDFQPYVTAGHWTYDDAQSWVWVSDYSWGWAPFHYGRWVLLPGRGWAWIPGRTYSGAWVVWRTGPVDYGYVGWAPAPPSWYWYNGVAVGWGFGWYSPYYVYCPRGYLYDPYVYRHVVYRGPIHDEAQARTRPYRPGDSRDPGRTVASPSVGGSGRTVASPRVGSRGPSPSELGLPPDAVAHPPVSHPGLMHAQALAAPRATTRSNAFTARRSGDVSNAIVSPPGSRLGATSPGVSSRVDAVARAPQYQGVAPSSPRPSWNGGASSYAAPPAPAPRMSPSFGASSPAFSARPSWSTPPGAPRSSVHASPSWSSPSFHSSPSVSSAPSFHSSPSVSSAPSFHSSPSVGGSFRSSPSVSSGHSSGSSFSHGASSSPRGGGGGGRRGR